MTKLQLKELAAERDAEYSKDASGNYAASVTQADAVVLKQG